MVVSLGNSTQMTINSKVESFEIARLKEQLHKLQVLQQKAQEYLKAKRDAEEGKRKSTTRWWAHTQAFDAAKTLSRPGPVN